MTPIYTPLGILFFLFAALQTQAQTVVQPSKQVSIDAITQKNQSTPVSTIAVWEYQDKFWETNEANPDSNILQDSTLKHYEKINGVDMKEIKMILPQEPSDTIQSVQILMECNGKYWKAKHH